MNYYEILEIDENASTTQIRKHYYRLAKKYHPDKNNDRSLSERFKLLSEAYSTLSNPRKRYLYDIQMQFGETEKNDYSFSERELDLLYSYYEKIINSLEVKFIKTIYMSLPESAKNRIRENSKRGVDFLRTMFRRPENCECEESLWDTRGIKRIDATQLLTTFEITLKRKLSDVYENKCNVILLTMNGGCTYLYITHSDYTISLPNLNIQIETSLPPEIHINGYDIYVDYPINLYQHYYQTNLILNIGDKYIIWDKNKRFLETMGLKNPRTNIRGNLYINTRVSYSLEKEKLDKYHDTIKNIFDFEIEQ
jgi:DnaJ-class molecular chaperone